LPSLISTSDVVILKRSLILFSPQKSKQNKGTAFAKQNVSLENKGTAFAKQNVSLEKALATASSPTTFRVPKKNSFLFCSFLWNRTHGLCRCW